MSSEWIVVVGARQHNLKNITVRIPRNRLTVITGLSGSGKSSLAFDTLYAEGQRRYVESLSAYARQFLEQMEKPDVDRIDGLPPAIAIEQRNAGANPRSIVATTTEIYDYLRLLFAGIGRPHCPSCGKPITRQTAQEIVQQLLALPEGSRITLLAPVVSGRKGEHADVFEDLRKRGFVRARVDGQLVELEEIPTLDKRRKHTIEAVVDRLAVAEKVRSRLNDSVELALRTGDGALVAQLESPEGAGVERLFSEKNACVPCGLSFETLQPRHFSFNSPYGACPTCHGLGSVEVFDEELIVPNPELSIDDGAIQAWRRGGRRLILYYKMLLRGVTEHYGIDPSIPWKDLPLAHRRILLYGSGEEEVAFGFWRGGAWRRYTKPFEGVIPNLQRRLQETESDFTRERLRAFLSRQTCPACKGARLRPESLAVTIAGKSIRDVIGMSVAAALGFFDGLSLTAQEEAIAALLLREIRQRLTFLRDVGLDYLTLDRESGTLSGGEAQRIRLATQIGSGLVGVLYVLDEPSIGLHPRDNAKLLATLRRLRDQGNTVVVVEHDEQTIRSADWVIDLGPAAGRHGGEVMYEGDVAGLLQSERSLTARYLRGETAIEVPCERRQPLGRWLTVHGACANNLQNIDVAIPVGLLVCITGVSGSGKSTLVDDILRRALNRALYGSRERPGPHKGLSGTHHIRKVVTIDQSPIGRTPRSNPATYTGAFDHIRALFAALPAARMRGYRPGRFSFNVKGGRCERCQGDGVLKIEMHFLPDVYVPCELCRGRRYNEETLQIRYQGKNIAEVLDMTVDEALEMFRAIPPLERILRTMSEVGLGYLQLGQPATTLSGGEAQRVKLAAELSRRVTGDTLYILDEPTTGLHFADVHRLLDVLERLRDAGNTVLVIEHNLDVIKRADYLIDLGPEGGEAGGRVVAVGTPEQVAGCEASWTGRALRSVLGPRPSPDVGG